MRRGFLFTTGYSFVFGNDLRAQQQQGGADFQAEHDDDGRRHGAVDNIDLRQGRKIPDQHVARGGEEDKPLELRT